ncbi:MAG TPA: toll/interleukin-1 receptor domain-containing protein, partial [Vicinamibacterales bacterium]|nr:toll/interleukin-1 receptor domain-containing protein [Vicinamibacterales bacterium]
MADLFISYARSDRPRAEQLAHALERAGWSVWWDREIPPGRSFDEVIEEALSLARCVIVLWSEASVRSEWVKTEAAEAAQRRILVPILADGARIPLEFRRIQAASIDNWRHLEAAQGWGQLCDAVAALVDSPRRAPPAPPVPAAVSRVRTLWIATAVLTLGLAAVSSVLAMRWRSAGGGTPSATATVTPPAAPAPAPAPGPAPAPAAAA